MFTVKSGAEFLSDIKAIDPCLEKIRLSAVEVEKESEKVTYRFICDKTVSPEIMDKIREQADKITPPVFKEVAVAVTKIVSSNDLINSAISQFISENYRSVATFFKPTDVYSSVEGDMVKYTLILSPDNAEYIKRQDGIKKINAYLSHTFCSDFAGVVEIRENTEKLNLLDEEVYERELQKIEMRTVKVENIRVIDDENIGDTAVYIEDATDGEVTVCGKITEITERTTKTGKPFFIIHLDDTTGRTSGVYFSKKNTYEKIKKLAEGDAIIARGSIGDYNGRRSFTIDKINRCDFPQNFVKKDRFKKTAPKNYTVVFPSPATTVKVSTVFDGNNDAPQSLLGKEFVVFDLETTGLDIQNCGITEIGAVKISDGKIKEQFVTFVNPDRPIPPEIQKITGITPEMVKDAPKIDKVIPDFMKFIENCTLIGHNSDGFDLPFIKRFITAEEYELKNRTLDTLILSRKYIQGLKNYSLNTIADYFGVVFRHHRALSDAYATAEIFIEIAKIAGKI